MRKTAGPARRTVGAFEAKTHFNSLLAEVAGGSEIEITRRGVPVARMVPVPARPTMSVQQVVKEFKRLRKGRTLGGLSIRELINEGRRF
ncbi:MAG TPA: type II toxin-antitoxin system prevent-host-death family antitoxin [Terriglobales bacterium]|nr:type II toxin-antitoxin system prevent-host-death family antitoxin [Terriglobales bacterium]